jgi:hypothetical protein
VSSDLFEHIDGLRSGFYKPKHGDAQQGAQIGGA